MYESESASCSVIFHSLQPHQAPLSMEFSGQEDEWVAIPFSRRSSRPRDRTQVSHIAGGFFTSWAAREVQEILKWVAYPFASRSPHTAIELGSSALQEDSLPTELSGKHGSYSWAQYNHKDIYKWEDGDLAIGRGSWTKQAETGVIRPQAKNCQQPLDTVRDMDLIFHLSLQRNQPC